MTSYYSTKLCAVLAIVVACTVSLAAVIQPGVSSAQSKSVVKKDSSTTTAEEKKPAEGLKAEPHWKRISLDDEVWIDEKNKQVVVGGEICLTRGMLEMFACLKGTKEHESIVAANTAAFIVHAALQALGANPGTPVKFEPEYKPATGPVVDITVEWNDKDGKPQRARGQDWVRSIKTKDAMKYPWVFPGSGFWQDETTGKKHYMAEGGDFICVSNFPSAMLDVPVESSMDNEGLMFEAFTERIPERGTKVRLFLKPHLDKGDVPERATKAKPPAKAR